MTPSCVRGHWEDAGEPRAAASAGSPHREHSEPSLAGCLQRLGPANGRQAPASEQRNSVTSSVPSSSGSPLLPPRVPSPLGFVFCRAAHRRDFPRLWEPRTRRCRFLSARGGNSAPAGGRRDLLPPWLGSGARGEFWARSENVARGTPGLRVGARRAVAWDFGGVSLANWCRSRGKNPLFASDLLSVKL